MLWFLLFSFLTTVVSAPLQQNSLITLRTVLAPKAGGGNTAPSPPYGPLVLEEWNSSGLVQSWYPSCTLPGLSTETWTEGTLNPRYPWGDQVWFLCRNVPVNSSLATNPAPVRYMYLSEDGFLNTCIEDFVYSNGTNVLTIMPYSDFSQGLNVFYLLGGGTPSSGPASPARIAQPRIRVDSSFCGPADTEGSLVGFPQGISINQLRILEGTLYGAGLFQSSTGGLPAPTIFQIGAEGVLPTGTRNPTANIPNFPLILSSWTDPFSSLWWRTGFNRTAYVALYNNSNGIDNVFPLPSSSGTLGGVTWSIAAVRKETNDFAVYLTNTTHIVKNTLNGLQSGLAYEPVVQAPSGWRYLSAHARNPNIPTPSATATATASSSASASATATSSSEPTRTASPTATPSTSATSSPTSQPTSTGSSSSSASASAIGSSTATASRDPNTSPSHTPSPSPTSSVSISASPSTTPSNGTIPFPPQNAATTPETLSPGAQAGIGLGTLAVISIAGLSLLKFSPLMKNLWTQKFGKSIKTAKKGVSFRNPVSTADVPITISHNPHALVQYRLEQLKDLQKQISLRETQQSKEVPDLDRTKKQFGPVIVGNSV